jgi:Fe-S oxidoreductase
VVQPYRIDENLRYGPNYEPAEPKTHFQFPGDGFSFTRATERCVGVGECRREDSGTMCPSYMVTREEMHTTRGRAHMLFEMLRGDPLQDGWHSDGVKEALDLCLSCKGCKGDCPVNVDMATYKAEFLSHYFEHRLRPRHAYVFGLIHRWARMASVMPRVANLFSQTHVLSGLTKFLAGVERERKLPAFALQSFKTWFRQRKGKAASDRLEARPTVVLWPDTFNNYFHPWIAQAAVEVLEDAGFRVEVPEADMCCGRPLYDYGMLDTAEKWLKQILRKMRPQIESGIPTVVLEPSCGAVFRDEVTNLFPHDQDAQRLRRQTFLLGEFLAKHAPGYPRLRLERQALVHAHCHHRAIMGLGGETEMLKRLGLDFKVLDSGCCGMAGAFGFEKGEHYRVSVKCGERVLLPAVREADKETLIITNGFSCHEQIKQLGNRHALHLAEVLRLAMVEGRVPDAQERGTAEPKRHGDGERELHGKHRLVLAGAGAAIAGLTGAWLRRKKHAGHE